RIALSGYPSVLYHELYKGWYVTELNTYTCAMGGSNVEDSNTERTEALWTNYDPRTVEGEQDSLEAFFE
ncbi:MAG: hypothetical protein ACXADO_10055, partial [Candidatus Thorarchaeota archaeon]